MKNMNPDVMDILARYGRHDFACELKHDANLPWDPRCNCGFSQAQVKAQAQHDANNSMLKSLEVIAWMAQPGIKANAVRSLEVIHGEAKLALARVRAE